MQAELQAEIDRLNATIVDLSEQLEKTKEKLKQTEALIQGMRDKVTEAQARMEQSLKEHQERTRQVEEEYAQKEKDLRGRLRD